MTPNKYFNSYKEGLGLEFLLAYWEEYVEDSYSKVTYKSPFSWQKKWFGDSLMCVFHYRGWNWGGNWRRKHLITSKKGWNLKFPPFFLVEAAKKPYLCSDKTENAIGCGKNKCLSAKWHCSKRLINEKENYWNHRCLVGVGLDELHRLELTGFAAETITWLRGRYRVWGCR